MRVYHFLNTKWGLEALKKRCLKVSRIDELNDPFELLSPELSNETFRAALPKVKKAISDLHGIHCFSKHWTNPVLWSHYADKHRGICIGFEIPDQLLMDVIYTSKRTNSNGVFTKTGLIRPAALPGIISRKFSHWKYENEVRLIVDLRDKTPINGHYFSNFSDKLNLKQVIVGSESNISKDELSRALGSSSTQVEQLKARPAFKSFKVVRNRKKSSWL